MNIIFSVIDKYCGWRIYEHNQYGSETTIKVHNQIKVLFRRTLIWEHWNGRRYFPYIEKEDVIFHALKCEDVIFHVLKLLLTNSA